MDPGLLIINAAGAMGILGGAIAFGAGLRRGLLPVCVLSVALVVRGVAILDQRATPVVGSGSATVSAVLVLVGSLLLLRRPGTRLDGVRLVSEAVMIAAAAPLLMHVAVAVFDEPLRSLPPTAMPLALGLGVIVAIATRRHDPVMTMAASGAALLLPADASAATVPGVGPGLVLVLTNALAWSLLLVGLILAGSRAGAVPRSVLQMRPNTVAASLALALVTLAVGLVALFRVRVDLIFGGLLTAFLSAFWVQELIHGSQQKALLSQLAALAGTDPLTGLGNRRALSAALTAKPSGSTDEPGRFSVLTVDLDNFKAINTMLGHQVGDDLLVAVARAMRDECAGSGAQVFRMGGDEFAVLVPASGARPADPRELAVRLIGRVSAAAREIPGATRVDVSASVGVAHSAGAVDEPEQLIRSGDAMRAAKAAGRARVVSYDRSIAARQGRTDAIERRLRRAIEDGAVELHLQPIISLPEMRMCGMESLARWQDEELGQVTPTEFIAVAEDRGLIGDLGRQLTRLSMELLISTGAHAAGLVGGVNVSPTQLRQNGFAADLADLLAETGVSPGQFAIEVTESVRIEADDPAVAVIWELAELGLPVAIDDFGTGYASLSLISSLPAKILKLDRSITDRLDDRRGLAIARCVTEMARSLEVDVVAEGIETHAQLDVVRSLGVGFGQGWLFSKAVTPERFTDFVRDPDLALGLYRPAGAATAGGPASARSTPPAP